MSHIISLERPCDTVRCHVCQTQRHRDESIKVGFLFVCITCSEELAVHGALGEIRDALMALSGGRK